MDEYSCRHITCVSICVSTIHSLLVLNFFYIILLSPDLFFKKNPFWYIYFSGLGLWHIQIYIFCISQAGSENNGTTGCLQTAQSDSEKTTWVTSDSKLMLGPSHFFPVPFVCPNPFCFPSGAQPLQDDCKMQKVCVTLLLSNRFGHNKLFELR